MMKWLNRIVLHEKHITNLRSVTCHMGSHSVTCYPTQVNAPSQTGWYSTYLTRKDKRLL